VSTVVIVVSDLLFQSRISAAVSAAGAQGVVADDAASAAAAIGSRPALVIVDLHERGVDAPAIIRSAKSSGARVLAFGRHTEPAILRNARDAGADRVVPRSQLAEELPHLIAPLLASAQGEERGAVGAAE
jgi:DNA-binding NarL/FixJ family response regulator